MQHLIPLATATAAAAAPPPPITFFTFGNSKSPFRELLLNVLHNVHMVPRARTGRPSTTALGSRSSQHL